MRGRLFPDPARDLVAGPSEAHRRAAAGRAYYAAFQEARAALERWGIAVLPRENIHATVRLRFLYSVEPAAQEIGRRLDNLVKLRNEADYSLASAGSFRDAKAAKDAVLNAAELIELLDDIEADPTRRSDVVASIRP